MHNKFLVTFFVYSLFSAVVVANPITDKKGQKKNFTAERIVSPPKIDGVLDDEVWNDTANIYTFSQLEPDNGADASFATQVQIYYDDKSIYVMARMHDPEPDLVQRELGLRDDGDKNADHFAILFDTYNKGQNGFIFGVSAAGVQADSYVNNDDFDDNWDAVWKSEVKIDDKGWVVEMEIPYYAIRFPKQDVQSWGLNIYRKIQRKQEESLWNFVDKSIDGFVNQSGVLDGIEGVEPPLRLAFMPYASLIHSRDEASGTNETKFNGGMDLKWGLNEAFTLDMSLIPDFSQVQSDDQVLNLSAFEVRFDENRPFFTEGTDLFNRGGLFYSRRVGRTLGGFETLTEYDTVISTPGSAPLLNATKLSGRTKKGLGVGLFNGVTRRTYAEIATPTDVTNYTIDTNGNRVYSEYSKEEVIVDPLTNYNVFVIDQNLKNNSNIALINTNVSRTDGFENVNFTGAEFQLNDKTNTYSVGGFGAIGLTAPKGGLGRTVKNDKGYNYRVFLGKISGNWQFRMRRSVESHDYNPNDLGFLRSANEINHWAQVRYGQFNPVWIFNNWGVRINANHSQLYKPRALTGFNVNMNFNASFKNFWEIGGFGSKMGKRYDYFEARSDNNEQVFSKESSYFMGGYLGTDSRKAFYVNVDKGRWKMPDWDSHDHWHSIFIRYRVSNKLSFRYSMNYQRAYNEKGYVNNINDDIRLENNLGNGIIFGSRNVKTYSNVIGASYTFNNKMGLTLRVRHYWSTVDYHEFYELDVNGDLQTISYDGMSTPQSQGETTEPLHNDNFNAFNIDLNYSWQIAPGSFVTINWKDAIFDSKIIVQEKFGTNFKNMFDSSQQNTFSVKLTYFLDYLTVKNSIRKSKS